MQQHVFFPPIQIWDAKQDCIFFPADLNGQYIRCVISADTLKACFREDISEPVEVFKINRQKIEQTARDLILSGRVAKNDELLINTEDII